MPTIQELKSALNAKRIPYKSGMKKAELEMLLTNSSNNQLAGFTSKMDSSVFDEACRGLIYKGFKWSKLWCSDKKQDGAKMKIAVLQKDNSLDVIVVKAVAVGKGLGAGGAKWNIVHKVF